jgi:hypothetical protein
MFLLTEDRLPVGMRLHFEVRIAPSLTLDSNGVIIRSKESNGKQGYGIATTRIDVKRIRADSCASTLVHTEELQKS